MEIRFIVGFMIRPYISEINNRQEKQERLQNIEKDDCMPSVLKKKNVSVKLNTFEVWTGAPRSWVQHQKPDLLRTPLAKTPKYQGSFRMLKSHLRQ